MRRKLILFVCVLLGCYLSLAVWLRAETARQKHQLEQDNRNDLLLTANDPPLLTAVARGDAIGVTRLLQSGADTEGRDRAGHTPLLIAAREGDLNMAQQLLDRGAQVEAQDRIGRSALLYAIRANHNMPMVRLLIAHHADVRHKDRAGETPLMAACDSADTDLMALLLEHGAEVNTQDRFGLTPLMRVARGLSIERSRQDRIQEPGLMRQSAIKLLLDQGADVRPHDVNGWTALLYASENEPSEAVEMLLAHGADPSVQVRGRTPLRNAAYRGLVGNLKALLAGRADKQAYQEALMQATITGHDAAVQFLLDSGADVNACDQYGATPLMLAVANERLATAKLLLMRGANAGLRDIQGRGPLDYAAPGRMRAIRIELFGNSRFRRL